MMILRSLGEDLISINSSNHNPTVLFILFALSLFQFYQIHRILPLILRRSCYP